MTPRRCRLLYVVCNCLRQRGSVARTKAMNWWMPGPRFRRPSNPGPLHHCWAPDKWNSRSSGREGDVKEVIDIINRNRRLLFKSSRRRKHNSALRLNLGQSISSGRAIYLSAESRMVARSGSGTWDGRQASHSRCMLGYRLAVSTLQATIIQGQCQTAVKNRTIVQPWSDAPCTRVEQNLRKCSHGAQIAQN